MIDFACKTFDINEIIKCSLGLTRAEKRLFDKLLANPKKEYTAGAVAKELQVDLTTVQRGLKKLTSKRLVSRGQHNFEGGGYQYTYKVASKAELKQVILKTIGLWTGKVEQELAVW